MRDMLVSSALRLRREQSLLLARIFHPLILVVAGLVAADQLGLDVGLLASLVTIVAAAAFGGLAFAFGMGAGSTVENIFAIRELRRMYRPGERVRVGEVEGVIVEENSVLSMGVYLGQSTKILDRTTGQILYGRVPAGSVVVSGNLPSPDGKYSLYCAVIVKKVDAKTRAKTSLNELLRGD